MYFQILFCFLINFELTQRFKSLKLTVTVVKLHQLQITNVRITQLRTILTHTMIQIVEFLKDLIKYKTDSSIFYLFQLNFSTFVIIIEKRSAVKQYCKIFEQNLEIKHNRKSLDKISQQTRLYHGNAFILLLW